MKRHYIGVEHNVSPNEKKQEAWVILDKGKIHAVKCVYDGSYIYGWHMAELNNPSKKHFPYSEQIIDTTEPYAVLKHEMASRPYDGIGCDKKKVVEYKDAHKNEQHRHYQYFGVNSVKEPKVGETYIFLNEGYMRVGVCTQIYGNEKCVLKDVCSETYVVVDANNVIESGSELLSPSMTVVPVVETLK